MPKRKNPLGKVPHGISRSGGVATNVAPPGGSSAVPGAPAGTVSTTPKNPGLVTAQAKAKRVKAKKAFGNRARKAFKKEYGSDWKEKVFGQDAEKVSKTYESARKGDGSKAASLLTARFQNRARKLGLKPPMPKPKAKLTGSVSAPPPPGAPVTSSGAAVPAPKAPGKKRKKRSY